MDCYLQVELNLNLKVKTDDTRQARQKLGNNSHRR